MGEWGVGERDFYPLIVTSSAANSTNIAAASQDHALGIPTSSGVQPLNRL